MSNSVKILVVYHKKYKLPHNDIYVPINAGRTLAEKTNHLDLQWLKDKTIGDDTGKNISEKNPYYCELTAHYWAWKNYEEINSPDFIGLVHYRRYFNFSEKDCFRYSDVNLLPSILDSADIIMPEKVPIWSRTQKRLCRSFFEQYSIEQHQQDLLKLEEIISNQYPQMLNIYKNIVYCQKEIYWCNMFVMKKEIFFEYSEWLFGILSELEKRVRIESYTIQEQRIFGYLSEILINIFVEYKIKESSKIRVKEYPVFKVPDNYNPNIYMLKEHVKKIKSKIKGEDVLKQHIKGIIKKSFFYKWLQQFIDKKFRSEVKDREYSIIKSIWETKGVTDDLLSYCGFLESSDWFWKNTHSQFWLIYISSLYEIGEIEKAREILDKYVKINGLKNIEFYLPVAKLAFESNVSNMNIEKANEVFCVLERNRMKRAFYDYLIGKRIAIVGNSRNEIGKNRGSEIDNHDIVIRFNNYELNGYEEDYGHKTNVWIRGSGASDVNDRENIEEYDFVIWEADYWHYPVKYNFLEIMSRDIFNNPEKILYFDYETHLSLRRTSSIGFPSSGAVAIWDIYRNLGSFDNIDIYGFSFLEMDYTDIGHYYGGECNISRDHAMKEEIDFFHKLYTKEKK